MNLHFENTINFENTMGKLFNQVQQGLSDKEALLAQLSDIRLPNPVGIWPPAPGWWLLAVTIIVSISAGLYFSIHYLRKDRYRKQAFKILKNIELTRNQYSNTELIEALTSLLKRTVLSAYSHSRNTLAGLYGKDFYRLLEISHQKTGQTINPEWHDAVYKNHIELDPGELLNYSRCWILHHKSLTRDELAGLLPDIFPEGNSLTKGAIHSV